jgi:hypothetical protein
MTEDTTGTRELAALPRHLQVRYVVRESDAAIIERATGRELSFDEADRLAARHGFSLFDV